MRRALPQSFVLPWDSWLQTVVGAARDSLGDRFESAWDAAPCWRFCLPPGVCGDDAVAGVLMASEDAVGRRFPLTLATLLDPGQAPPQAAWFDALEEAGRVGRQERHSVEQLMRELQPAPASAAEPADDEPPILGWWTREGRRHEAAELPAAAEFLNMVQGPRARRDGEWVADGISHPGTVRTRNEDAFVDRTDLGLWAVADGAGGHDAGDVASAAVASALAALPSDLSASEVLAQVRLRLAEVHEALKQRGASSASGSCPATTVVVLLARGEHFACLWAGDSRAYLLRDGSMNQVTQDHSLVQEMVESGLLAPEDAEGHPQANVITRAIGAEDDLHLDKVSGRLVAGDRMLLCTDGLFKALREPEIEAVLSAGGGAEQLLQQALQAGARDNVTAVVVST